MAAALRCSAILLILSLFAGGDAIHCYLCGTGGDAHSCEMFAKASLWRPYEVECPSSPEHVCVKTVTVDQDDQQTSEVRGCTPLENAFSIRNPVRCGRPSQLSQETVFCLCDTDLCNDARRRRPIAVALILPLAVVLFAI